MLKPASSGIFYDGYIELVETNHFAAAAIAQESNIKSFFESISEEKAQYAYAPGKWTLKQMLLHIIDTERIFAYRALAIVRGEKQALLGFDENEYADNATAKDRSWTSLCEEFNLVRKANLMLFNAINDEEGTKLGFVGTTTVTAAHFAYATIGHMYHHINIVKERYF